MKAFHIILESDGHKQNIEPIFLSYETAVKRLNDLKNAIKFDCSNKTKYYLEEIKFNE